MIKIALVSFVFLFCANFIILESYQTHISSPIITSDKTNYKQGEDIVISGWVNYNEEATSDVLLRIIVSDPLEMKIFDEYVTSNTEGEFFVEIPTSKDSKVGNYDIEITSQCREIHREICTHQNESISITVEKESSQDKKIPDWIKNVFVWYAQDIVTEGELLSAIEFLVNQKIIQIQTNNR
ncbi:hypothetical protein [Nitrosopumilus sp.]|uniref:hypothetical protein n=1 Tax=Nitrosopumilus sp. TaxID=2024843 RepID=UPI003B5AB962